jgi:hypothetical protein
MTPTKLYVDQLSDDGKLGIVTTASTISYNINAINLSKDFINKVASDNEAGNCGRTGTYLYILGISLDKRKYGMFFIDANHPKLWEIVESNLGQEYLNALEHFHSEIHLNYDQYLGKTILAKEPSPLL